METKLDQLIGFRDICYTRTRQLPFYSERDVLHIGDDGFKFNLVYGSQEKSFINLIDDCQVMHEGIFENPKLTYLFMQFMYRNNKFTGDVNGAFSVAEGFKSEEIVSHLIKVVEDIAKDLGGKTINYHGYSPNMWFPLILESYRDLGIYRGLPRLAKLLSED